MIAGWKRYRLSLMGTCLCHTYLQLYAGSWIVLPSSIRADAVSAVVLVYWLIHCTAPRLTAARLLPPAPTCLPYRVAAFNVLPAPFLPRYSAVGDAHTLRTTPPTRFPTIAGWATP